MRNGHRILLIGLTVIALFCWIWTASAFRTFRSLRSELNALRSKRAELTRRIDEAKKLSERYETFVQDLGKPLTEFDAGRMISKLMEQVEGAFTQSKVRVETLQPLPWQVLTEEQCVRLAVQVNATTTQSSLADGLQGLTELLLRLRSLRPPILAERLSLQAIEQPKSSLRLQMQLAWFVPLEEAVLKKLAPPQRRPSRHTLGGESREP